MKIKLPNLTLTRGTIEGGVSSGSLLRRIRRVVAWGALGFVMFVFFVWLSLPTRALAWRISHEAKRHGFIVQIEDISVSPFGGITLEKVAWTFAPSRPDEIPGKWFVDEIEVDVSIFKLLFGTIDVDIEMVLEEGAVRGSYVRGSDMTSIAFEVEGLPLYEVPKARQSLNAPLSGLLTIKAELELPEHKFADATGFIELNCSGCKIGDGETKLYVPGSLALKNGLTIPEVDMGNLSGRMTVADGKAKTDGPIETDSEDVWVWIDGEVVLKDPFSRSRIDMVLKFNLSDRLQAESEPMRFMIQTANKSSKLDPPERGLGFVLDGPVGKPKFRGIKTKTRLESRADKRAKTKKKDTKKKKPTLKKPKTSMGEDTGGGPEDAKAAIDDRGAMPPPDEPRGDDGSAPPSDDGSARDDGNTVPPPSDDGGREPPPLPEEGGGVVDDGAPAPGDEGAVEPPVPEEPPPAEEGGGGEAPPQTSGDPGNPPVE